jgi:hypothetical protein
MSHRVFYQIAPPLSSPRNGRLFALFRLHMCSAWGILKAWRRVERRTIMQSPSYQPTPVAVPAQPKRAGKCLYITLGIVAVVALLLVGTLVVAVALDGGAPATVEDEGTYKLNTTASTVASLDKAGTAGANAEVSFTCTIGNFVKDDNGLTAGANVNDPSSSSVIQVAFPTGTDITRLNSGDVLQVWGTDQGTDTGQNGFGVTIQEVVIHAKYLDDQTTGYLN